MIRPIITKITMAAALALFLLTPAFGQRTYEIFRTACPGATPSPANPFVTVTPAGAISLVTCTGQGVTINGTPITGGSGITSLNSLTPTVQTFATAANDTFGIVSSGSTHTFRTPITSVSGTSRTTFFPYFNAQNTLAKAPFSWDGTAFTWNNTALNSTFPMLFDPTSGSGSFIVGNDGASLFLDQANSAIEITGTDAVNNITRLFVAGDSGAGNSTQFKLTDSNKSFVFTSDNHLAATFNVETEDAQLGDVVGAGNNTLLHVDDASAAITLSASNVKLSQQTVKGVLGLDAAGNITSTTLTNGQLLIGNTGSAPTAAGLTAGTGIAITNGAGSITIASDGTSPLSSALAADYTNATSTFSNTALSVPVAAAGTYAFTLQAFVSDSLAADGGKIDFAGGSATFTNFIAGSNSALVTGTTSANTGTFSNATITGTNLITISGTATINAGGTFIVRAAQVAHTVGTLTMARGSRLMLNKL